MRNKAEKILKAFGGKLVGTKFMQRAVCETLAHMPDKIIRVVSATCWFVSSMEDAWAFTFTGNDLRNNHLIFLSDDLLSQDTRQIRYSVAHEIGHVILGHRNAVLARQTKAEIRKQEKEADAFAQQFIK